MSAAPGFSVKQQCAKRIISEMVEKVPGFKIMCVDQMAMKVVGSCLKVSDVTDLGIAVIEPITNEREPQDQLLGSARVGYCSKNGSEVWISLIHCE